MTLTLDIDQSAFEKSVLDCFASVKVPCQAAMANTFATVVHHNFGDDGEDRPSEWQPLRKGYAERYHGGDRTPKLILSGDLQRSIEIDEAGEEAATVSTSNPYAILMQEGGQNEEGFNIPARPFFPIVGGEATPYTAQKCLDACGAQLERSLR